MSKRFHLMPIILAFIILPSCRLMEPISPEISGDVSIAVFPSPSITEPSISPIENYNTPPNDKMSPSFSPEDQEIRVIIGTYMEERSTPYSTYKLTSWMDTYYWPRNTVFIFSDGIIMGELDAFAKSFGFTVVEKDDMTHELIIDENYVLIFTSDSNIAFINGESILLESSAIYTEYSSKNKGSRLFIPLSCVAEAIGLYTRQCYFAENDMHYLWLSECAVLDESEFESNENYEAPTLSIWTDDNGGNHSSNVYELKEDGNTYSGVEIGHSREEVIEILGAPEYQESFTIEQDYHPGDSRIMYYCNPQQMNDLGDFLDIYFANGFVSEIHLNKYNWED